MNASNGFIIRKPIIYEELDHHRKPYLPNNVVLHFTKTDSMSAWLSWSKR